jgi:hypothetical protein
MHLSWDRSLGNRVLIPLAILFLIFLSGFFNRLSADQDLAAVTTASPVKFEPRDEATTYFDLSEGNQVKVLRTEGVWAKIKRLDGKEGWVLKDNIERIENHVS